MLCLVGAFFKHSHFCVGKSIDSIQWPRGSKVQVVEFSGCHEAPSFEETCCFLFCTKEASNFKLQDRLTAAWGRISLGKFRKNEAPKNLPIWSLGIKNLQVTQYELKWSKMHRFLPRPFGAQLVGFCNLSCLSAAIWMKRNHAKNTASCWSRGTQMFMQGWILLYPIPESVWCCDSWETALPKFGREE